MVGVSFVQIADGSNIDSDSWIATYSPKRKLIRNSRNLNKISLCIWDRGDDCIITFVKNLTRYFSARYGPRCDFSLKEDTKYKFYYQGEDDEKVTVIFQEYQLNSN